VDICGYVLPTNLKHPVCRHISGISDPDPVACGKDVNRADDKNEQHDTQQHRKHDYQNLDCIYITDSDIH